MGIAEEDAVVEPSTAERLPAPSFSEEPPSAALVWTLIRHHVEHLTPELIRRLDGLESDFFELLGRQHAELIGRADVDSDA